MTTQNTNRKTLWETCRNKITVNLSVGYQPESIEALRHRFLTGTQESGDNLAIIQILREVELGIADAYNDEENFELVTAKNFIDTMEAQIIKEMNQANIITK